VSYTAVVGLGEVGQALLDLIDNTSTPVRGIDIDPVELPERGSVDVMHVCFPFEIPDFVGEAARYIALLDPGLTVVNSTVGIGTTRAIYERTGARIAHSPVRGKHVRMVAELVSYVKYIGGIDATVARQAARHFESLGMHTRIASCPEATELAKLSETTYFALQITFAQEIERYCDRLQLDYDEIVSFYEEIPFLPPVKYFPGVIGGHCVMPNIEILSAVESSPILEAIRWSNTEKVAREAQAEQASRGAARG
jgi:UDP-N-acetyl-D-mannosaminuronate dehydrogenase